MATATHSTTVPLSALRCAAGTDVGMHRDENQDSFGIIKSDSFQGFFVADGMGGVKGGAIASRLAIATLQELLPGLDGKLSPDTLRDLVATVNSRIFEKGSAQPGLAGMGTTLVGLVFTSSGLISVNVGDSRAYRIRGDSITQLSEDHTVVSELVKSGAISTREAEGHPVSHMLTRSLGPLPEVVVESKFEMEAPIEGDVYVLCSDGLYNFVNNQDILDVIKQNPLDDANQILINLANRRGGSDNITVVVVSIGERQGKGRGSEYRTVRERSPATEAREVSRSDSSAQVMDDPKIPPAVAEPKDLAAEQENIKRKNRGPESTERELPGYLKIVAAVFFGLLVGDLGRRSGIVPDFSSNSSTPTTFQEGGTSQEGGGDLNKISKDLNIRSTSPGTREGLPDIARRVRGTGGEGGSGELGRGSRERSPALVKALEGAIAKTEAKLAALESTSVADAARQLEDASEKLKGAQEQIDDIETQIDAASRKLSLWFGRKKRLETSEQDVFKPANDLERVGAASTAVKKKIAECTEASYMLQAKQDEYELYPSNERLRDEVKQLELSRERLLEELRREVDKAVDVVLADANRQLEDLKIRRDVMSGQLETAQERVDFLKVLSSSDPLQRESLKQRLSRDLAESRTSLKEATL